MFYCLLSKRARSFISKNMGNEQHGGTSHHFIADSSNEEYQIQKGNSFIWTKNGLVGNWHEMRQWICCREKRRN